MEVLGKIIFKIGQIMKHWGSSFKPRRTQRPALRLALGRGHRGLSAQDSGAVWGQARRTQLPAPSLHGGLSTQHSANTPVDQLALGSDWLRSFLP